MGCKGPKIDGFRWLSIFGIARHKLPDAMYCEECHSGDAVEKYIIGAMPVINVRTRERWSREMTGAGRVVR